MKASDPAPYAGLTPETILDAIDSVGLRADGRLFALNSFENRVYQVGLDDDSSVIAKFYRPHRWSDEAIGEEHAFMADLVEAELPVVAPLNLAGKTLHHHAGFRFSVSPRRGGRAPEWDTPGTLEWMGRFIARIHGVGERRAFAHRPTLTVASFGEASRDFLLANACVPMDLATTWRSVADRALDAAREAFEGMRPTVLRVHGDCHGGNVLWTDAGPHFVDFDDCLMGPAVQDVWMMLSGAPEEMQRQWRAIVSGYRAFRDFDERERVLIEPLRTLRLLHTSAWLARRWADPAFPLAFPWFATSHYWQERVHELEQQVAAMRGPGFWV